MHQLAYPPAATRCWVRPSRPASGRLQRFFGVSHIKIDPQLTDITSVPQARLTLEQQVSPDVTLTYITNLSRTDQQIVRVEWDLSKQWSVVALRDENGAFGIDFQVPEAIQVGAPRTPMRLRKMQGKLKVEHSIIDGVREVLERLLRRQPRDPVRDSRRDPAGSRRERRGEDSRDCARPPTDGKPSR